jgi:hypothetical protein
MVLTSDTGTALPLSALRREMTSIVISKYSMEVQSGLMIDEHLVIFINLSIHPVSFSRRTLLHGVSKKVSE